MVMAVVSFFEIAACIFFVDLQLARNDIITIAKNNNFSKFIDLIIGLFIPVFLFFPCMSKATFTSYSFIDHLYRYQFGCDYFTNHHLCNTIPMLHLLWFIAKID